LTLYLVYLNALPKLSLTFSFCQIS